MKIFLCLFGAISLVAISLSASASNGTGCVAQLTPPTPKTAQHQAGFWPSRGGTFNMAIGSSVNFESSSLHYKSVPGGDDIACKYPLPNVTEVRAEGSGYIVHTTQPGPGPQMQTMTVLCPGGVFKGDVWASHGILQCVANNPPPGNR